MNPVKEMALTRHILETAAGHPDRVAFCVGEERLSYRELAKGARHQAEALSAWRRYHPPIIPGDQGLRLPVLLLGCLLAHARLHRHPMLSGSRLLGRRHPDAHLPGVGLNLHPWHDLLLQGLLRLLGGLLGRCHLLSGVLGSDGILLGDGCLLGTLLGSRLRHGALLGSRLRDRRLSGTCLSGRLRLLRCRLCARGLLGACLGSSRLCWLLP